MSQTSTFETTDRGLTFEYKIASLREFQMETAYDDKGRAKCKSMEFCGEVVKPTDRFWTSFMARAGFGKAIFKYFTHEEVFERVADTLKSDEFRFCLERKQDREQPRLLAVSAPTSAYMAFGSAMDLLNQWGGGGIKYSDGVITSMHMPRSGERESQLGPDIFTNRFMLNTPVDGYGQPNLYLSLLRQVCSNGMVAYTKAFKTQIKGGNDIGHALERALESFDSDEGFTALHRRFTSAQRSWASIAEANALYKTLVKHTSEGNIPGSVCQKFHELTGEINSLYGIINPDSLGAKRQRMLPVKCSVYELLNLATETATHKAAEPAFIPLQKFVGDLIGSSDGFDLEESMKEWPEFQDLYLATGNSEANNSALAV